MSEQAAQWHFRVLAGGEAVGERESCFCLLLSVNSEKKKKKDFPPRLSRPGGTPRSDASETNPDLSDPRRGKELDK